MSAMPPQSDLVVLTACKNAQFALQGIVSRHESLRIRPVVAPIFLVHPDRDPGVLQRPEALLRSYVRSHAHALVIMDREGSGDIVSTRIEMETIIEDRLKGVGWAANSVAAVVIDPELEIWVWANSPHVDSELGWKDRQPSLSDWLRNERLLTANAVKPLRPKEAMEAALRLARKPRSSAIYKALAEKTRLSQCTDLAFLKLRDTLSRWFARSSR